MNTNELLEQRAKTHGEFKHVANVSQHIKSIYVNVDFTATKRESLDMIASKLGRIICGNSDEPDHWRDIAGYATLVANQLEEDASCE